jgi:hypothetical protein
MVSGPHGGQYPLHDAEPLNPIEMAFGGPVETESPAASLIRKQRPQDALTTNQMHPEATQNSAIHIHK